jgi:hypothetical protein
LEAAPASPSTLRFRYLRLDEAARVWTPRRPFAPPVLRDARHIDDLGSLEGAAAAQGLRLASARLWRGLRFWPYVVPIPRPFAFRLWDHGVFILEKPAA